MGSSFSHNVPLCLQLVKLTMLNFRPFSGADPNWDEGEEIRSYSMILLRPFAILIIATPNDAAVSISVFVIIRSSRAIERG